MPEPSGKDTVATINRLFVTALTALARAGEAEQACRLAASGWWALRDDNAREAERLNAALHGLVRLGPLTVPTEGVDNG